MSEIISKCTVIRPTNVGWFVGRNLFRSAVTPLCLFKCSHFLGFYHKPTSLFWFSEDTKDYFIILW